MTAMTATDPSSDFGAFVDDLARRLASHSPTFEAFVAAMPGVLPDEALGALKRLGGIHAKRLVADAEIDRAGAIIDQCSLLPLPHPLDSEFRFDGPSAKILATALVESTRDGDEILLIGVPSVAVEIAAMSVDRKIRFLGPDNCVTNAIRSAFGNGHLLLDQGPGGTAAAALLDPPWYRDPMAELILVCASGCAEGALIKLVLPPIGTRPEVSADRTSFIELADAAGLTPTGIEGPVCYRTPLFELAAMERQGIARLPSWRRGEAVEFRAGKTRPSAKWLAPRSTELSVEGVRLRLEPKSTGRDPTLVPLSDHEVFPSVSSRAPGRNRATLWTTTNRAFSVDYELARTALGEVARLSTANVLHFGIGRSELDPKSAQRVATDGKLIHQLAELVGREVDDARRLVGDGAWLKTEMEWRS